MSGQINPDDFIITRKRKKYKFAKFSNSPLCFEFEEWKKQPADVIELGAGTALFLVELASKYPKKSFVAVDVKADRLQKGAYEAAERELTNIRFLRARADQLLDCFEAGKTSALWLTFPDPFPKVRSARRRMTHPIYLARYAALLRQGPTLNRVKKSESAFQGLYLKHDNLDFFHWSLEQLVREKWHIAELSFDLHESELPDDYKTMTTYETRWTSQGMKTNFVKATVQ
ncbi:hypothetical protein RAAC3_TM7C00001G0245 [Candidatus Saccharibacteria bacterium RAAC3_TM7_1]|nr:hypothetical protein RAAC3_TM7C00001G0245 [Candidatus Saccharibacteria bacterium RAAC3_TM7_1]HCZ28269.1 methyltransferase domain-containing protein [Candidatus Saccharibacteria bacterium]